MMTHSPWLIRPTPIEGEIFSSYLARIARANGMSPYRFFSFHFPGFPIWNRDIDRSASDNFLRAVAIGCNINFEAMVDMTLRSFEGVLQGQPVPERKGVVPWINATGIYHRDRKGFAMQYCPLCLAEDLAYKAIWRLSFVTVCQHHLKSLLDCCQHCGAQVVFHRNEVFYCNCHRCGRPLTQVSPSSYIDYQIDTRLTLQTTLLSAINCGHESMGSIKLESGELFWGLTILMRVVRAKLRAIRRNRNQDCHLTCVTQRIELLRIQDRACQCTVLAELMSDWPNQFLHFAASHGLTQIYFYKEVQCPQWLRHTIAMLPVGTRRVRTATNTPIRNKLRNIHRNKKKNWRTERAKLLLKQAGIRS